MRGLLVLASILLAVCGVNFLQSINSWSLALLCFGLAGLCALSSKDKASALHQIEEAGTADTAVPLVEGQPDTNNSSAIEHMEPTE